MLESVLKELQQADLTSVDIMYLISTLVKRLDDTARLEELRQAQEAK